jgi:hypothetical protein
MWLGPTYQPSYKKIKYLKRKKGAAAALGSAGGARPSSPPGPDAATTSGQGGRGADARGTRPSFLSLAAAAHLGAAAHRWCSSGSTGAPPVAGVG